MLCLKLFCSETFCKNKIAVCSQRYTSSIFVTKLVTLFFLHNLLQNKFNYYYNITLQIAMYLQKLIIKKTYNLNKTVSKEEMLV